MGAEAALVRANIKTEYRQTNRILEPTDAKTRFNK